MAWLLPEGEESKQGESTRSAGREEWDEGVNGGGGRGGGRGAECESGEQPYEPIRSPYLRSEAKQEKPNR